MFEIGITRAAPSIGIIDYSLKETDDFGITTVVPRASAKRYEVNVVCATNRVDAIAAKLTEVRAMPVVWLADKRNRHASLLIYGFYKDWEVTIKYPNLSECRLTIEGLT